jgi:hypothetical protein
MKTHIGFRPSKNKLKKYDALFSDGSYVSFGSRNYQHYKDTTGLGQFSHLDHLDKKRRDRYYKRHSKDYPKYSPDWFSKNYLWPKI